MNLDIFGDNRKIPNITVNVKVKVKDLNQDETRAWNKAFGYIMRKKHSKLEFLVIDTMRELPIKGITLDDIKSKLTEEDYAVLQTVENIFNTKISIDLKAFILAMLRMPIPFIMSLK